VYVIQKGDVLSKIVKKHFPNEDIYGKRGKLSELMFINPKIKNPNLIFPNTLLILRTGSQESIHKADLKDTESSKEKETVLTKENSTHHQEVEHWDISATYGGKFVSLSQDGVLGDADLGVIFLQNLKLKSVYHQNLWSFGMEFELHKFKYETLS
jgi:hypothetical protein